MAADPDRIPSGCWVHGAMVECCRVNPHHPVTVTAVLTRRASLWRACTVFGETRTPPGRFRAASGLAGGSGDGVDAVGGAGGVDFAGEGAGDADPGDDAAVKGYGQAAGEDAEALDVNRSEVGLRVVLDRGGGHLEADGGDGLTEAHLHRGAGGGVGTLLGDDDAVTVDNGDRDGVALRQG